MKKSQLQQIIKEEISKALNEIDPTQSGFDDAMRNAGVELSTGGSNTQQSAEFIQGKRAYETDLKSGEKTKNPYAEPESYAERMASTMTWGERNKKATEWTLGYAAARERNPPPSKPTSQPDLSSYYGGKSGRYTGD
jgi:hypothetical protein